MSAAPATKSRRFEAWLAAQRGPKQPLDPARAYAAVWEQEPDASGTLVPTAVVFLTNRECPFRCVMCDLWVNTLDAVVPPGAIAGQIRTALAGLQPARQIKLYNAGSFFDPMAIPPDEDEGIAACLDGFDRVIVEAHPAFLAGRYGERCLTFRDRLRGRLEVAIGLETAHPGVLARLNKHMTQRAFEQAAAFLAANDLDLRVFLLIDPPFMPAEEAAAWRRRSIDAAAAAGAVACSLIPTRPTPALAALDSAFAPPRLPALEEALEHGLAQRGMRVFVDEWDLERFFDCTCSPARAARLQEMNRRQAILPRVSCETCGTGVMKGRPFPPSLRGGEARRGSKGRRRQVRPKMRG